MEAHERPYSRRYPSSTASEAAVVHGEWRRLNEIGKGSFAMVYKGIHTTKGVLVAIKSVNLTKLTSKLKANLDEEVNILRKLHHPHIVAMFDCIESKTQVHLVMEFCELGDLSTFIKKRASLTEHETTRDMLSKYPNPDVGGLHEVICRHFLKQISSALEYLHARSFLHRDIKPQNLLLVPSPVWYENNRAGRMPLLSDKQVDVPPAGIHTFPQLKIADFGFARFLPSLSLAETLCGSPLYMAPEILRYEKYDNKADLWSVGTVLHEMVVGKPPFRASNHVELLRRIEKAEDKIRFPEGNSFSTEMKFAIRSLLKKNPIERISYEKFFALDVITQDIPGLLDEDLPKQLEEVEQPAKQSEAPITKADREAVSPMSPVLEPSLTCSRPPSRRLSAAQGKRPTDLKQPSSTAEDAVPLSPRTHLRRPSLASHATAPGRQQERRSSFQSTAPERASREQPTSMLKAHLDRERGLPEDKALREIREKAAQDVAFERDYVLIEKRAVEVNAFADEMGHSPLVQQGQTNQPGAMIRRATTVGTPLSTTAPTSTGTRAMQVLGRRTSLHQRTGSYERGYGRSPNSATSAISRALNMANLRLFGVGISPPAGKGISPPRGYTNFPMYPTAESSILMIGDGGKTVQPRDDDTRIAMLIEGLATRSDVVWGFAEVKYQQLLPSRPLSPAGMGGLPLRKGSDVAVVDEEDDLTLDAVITIGEEALVLYVKALSILARVIDIAGSWWGHRNRGEVLHASPRSLPVRGPASATSIIATKINGIVQWSRNRFNECLEKSEFVQLKLIDAQKRLPLDHPLHPSNQPSTPSTSTSGVGTSSENFRLTSGATAEKLMYDRALEMSRTAAVNELMNTELEAGEVSYRTAICMLEAILDNDDDRTGRSPLSRDGKSEEEAIDGLESEDRATVRKLLEGLKQRLRSLKKKLELQKLNKRHSITAPPPRSRNSPIATPGLSVTPPR